MIYCLVSRCPVDNENSLCCRYCNKSKDCIHACKRTNLSCILAKEKKEKED